MNNSGKIALCGTVTALGFLMMVVAGIGPVGMYFLPMLAGAIISILAIEIGLRWAFISFFAICILSALFSAQKESFLFFLLIFGHYPIFKTLIENSNLEKMIQFTVKIAIFNFSAVFSFFISIKLLSIPKSSFEIFGVYIPLVFLLLGNIVFLLYDRALSNMTKIYLYRYHKKVKKMLHLKEKEI